MPPQARSSAPCPRQPGAAHRDLASRPQSPVTLLVLCTAALAGLLAGELARLDRAALLITAAAGLVGAALAHKRPAWRLAACACIAAALGALRAEAHAAADQ